MKKYIFVSVIVFVLLFAAAIPAGACWMPPEPFTVQSDDGQREFHFRPYSVSWADPEITETMFAEISLHENGDELWRTEFHHLAFEGSFVFSDCLNYFAFFYPNTDVYALEFYANGERTRRYRVDELVHRDSEMWEVQFSIGYQWEDWETRVFEPATYLLQVNTVDDIGYEFDIRTGEPARGEYVDPPEAANPTQAEFPSTSAVSSVVWLALAGSIGIPAAATIIIILRRRTA